MGSEALTSVLRGEVERDFTTYRRRGNVTSGNRDWSDVATSQATPAATRSWKRHGTNLPEHLTRDTLIWARDEDFGLSSGFQNFERIICYSDYRKLIQAGCF